MANNDGTAINRQNNHFQERRLFFEARRGVLTCEVHDVTNCGAGILLQDLNVLPLDFELTFDNFRNIRRCRVIWRQGDFVGVSFQK